MHVRREAIVLQLANVFTNTLSRFVATQIHKFHELDCYNPIHLINWFQTLVYFDFVVRVTARKSTNLISPMVDATLGSVTNAYVTHILTRTHSQLSTHVSRSHPAGANATWPVDKPLLLHCSELKETLNNDKSLLRASNWQLTTTVQYFNSNQIWFFLIILYFGFTKPEINRINWKD